MRTIFLGALAGLVGGAYAFWYLFFNKRRGAWVICLSLFFLLALPLLILKAVVQGLHLDDPAAVKVLLRAWLYSEAVLILVFLVFFRSLKQHFKG